MGRFIVIASACLLACGCAAQQRPEPSAQRHPYVAASSSALIFEPPITQGMPHPELARAGRAPSAFLGFDQPTSEFYIRATNDLQTTDLGDFYTQESISVRTGLRYR